MGQLQEDLLTFFKALSDANRLRIIGLLSLEPFTVEQLASMLHLRASTISHHLSRLSEAELVSARAAGYYRHYHLEFSALEKMAGCLKSMATFQGIASEVDLHAYERDVFDHYSSPDGHLKTLPAPWKKRQAILRHIAKGLEHGVRYTEAQIDRHLLAYHEDVATIRQEMLDEGLLQLECELYWRPDPDQENTPADRQIRS